MRNEYDLGCLAVKDKYRTMNSFHKYYSGEKVAPVTTIFIGGNHEASNHLKELYVFMVGETSGVKWCGVGGGRRVSLVFNPLSFLFYSYSPSLALFFSVGNMEGGSVPTYTTWVILEFSILGDYESRGSRESSKDTISGKAISRSCLIRTTTCAACITCVNLRF